MRVCGVFSTVPVCFFLLYFLFLLLFLLFPVAVSFTLCLFVCARVLVVCACIYLCVRVCVRVCVYTMAAAAVLPSAPDMLLLLRAADAEGISPEGKSALADAARAAPKQGMCVCARVCACVCGVCSGRWKERKD